MITKDLGMVTAYAYAVAGGYAGTEEEFEELLGNIATDLAEIENLTVQITTLSPGSSATASYESGVLSLGIPRGDTGAAAGFGSVSASVDANTGTPEVVVTSSGPDTAKVFNFAFKKIKGETGATGNGIQSIYLSGESGAVKTYTILYTNGDTYEFQVTDGEVTNASLVQILLDYAKTDGYYENLGSGTADNLATDVKANDQSPYLFRTSGGSVDIGDREYANAIVGADVAWNQLCANSEPSATVSDVTFTNNGDGTWTVSGTASADITKYTNKFPVAPYKGHVVLYSENVPTVSGSYQVGDLNRYIFANGVKSIIRKISDTAAADIAFGIQITNGSQVNLTLKPQIHDLTLALGKSIADYVYTLESGTAGAGIAWLRKYGFFNKPYFAFDSGSIKSVANLVSHDTVGFNQWDEEYLQGYYSSSGVFNLSDTQLCTKNLIPCVPNTAYYIKMGNYAVGVNMASSVLWYDADENFITRTLQYIGAFTSPSNAHYMKFNFGTVYGGTYNHDICINLHWDGSRDGEYEPYVKHSYPLDSDAVLHGKLKLDANNNLHADGDVYLPSGEIDVEWGEVDMGDLNWQASQISGIDYFYASLTNKKINSLDIVCSKYVTSSAIGVVNSSDKQITASASTDNVFVIDSAYNDPTVFKSAMAGQKIVYKLATPTTETADPYQATQLVDDFGTEEFVLSSGAFPMPVGHNTDYPVNLKAKLEMAPNSPSGDGVYVVKQTGGENEYVPLVIPSGIPSVPSADGTYTLKATVSGGTTTLSWS